MATDLESLAAMCDRAGVVYEIDPEQEAHSRLPDTTQMVIRAKSGPHNDGYMDFLTIVYFTIDGTMSSWATWE